MLRGCTSPSSAIASSGRSTTSIEVGAFKLSCDQAQKLTHFSKSCIPSVRTFPYFKTWNDTLSWNIVVANNEEENKFLIKIDWSVSLRASPGTIPLKGLRQW
jgi:hypothetical protein